MISLGGPCNFTICSMFSLAKFTADLVDLGGMKYADFVNRSTMTHIESCCICVNGRPTTKSQATHSHFQVGTSIDFSNPPKS